MRPVNLIPPEDRRGEQAPLRTGPLAYVLIGALVAILAGVIGLVLTGNQISERQDEVATLKREDAAASAKATRLVSYTQFRNLSESRVATVQSLADSRFDWERVLRELALILPSDVWLESLNASGAAGSGGESEGGEAGGLRGGTAGPALELNGCAVGQAGVAGFVTALKDIDGVTRVGVQSSSGSSEEGGAASVGEGQCGAKTAPTTFAIVVAFDAAPVPVTATEGGLEAPAEEAEATSEDEGESGESDESGESTEGG